MSELFTLEDQGWSPVSPALARLRHLVLLGSVAVGAVALLAVGLLLPVPWWVVLLAALVLVGSVAPAWVLIDRNARWWGYVEREEDLVVKHGALFRRMVVVPYGRMQYVDVHAGPLEQAFHVATVHLHTASPGTSARIPGLPRAEAARLRDRLTDRGESQAAGL